MVDFRNQVRGRTGAQIIDPVELYDTLDRRSDKGPLRPTQTAVLSDWHKSRRDDKDVVLKMHTGQGKTLCGLLMLQSRLNQTNKPALYVCANKFLAEQTIRQAKEFGIKAIGIHDEIPLEFHNGECILVCHVQKFFNGRTKFGTHSNSLEAGAIVIDDAHASIQTIRESCLIDLPSSHAAYRNLLQLFDADLSLQGRGTHKDIVNGQYDALLPVPYWAWEQRIDEVTDIVGHHSGDMPIVFAWPLLRDILHSCYCFVSGHSLQIVPYTLPVDAFGTYWNCPTRIFMSATMADDSILIKDFGVDRQSIQAPLIDKKEGWSGEKMVLMPRELSNSLDSSELGILFGKTQTGKRPFGIVVLVPSFKASNMWKQYGAKIVDRDKIDDEVQALQQGNVAETRVFVNRYEGIDLPDASCRVLILDGAPYAGDLLSRYESSVRVGSDILDRQQARTVEQGMGRSVRGTRDYSVVVLNGGHLVRLVRSRKTRGYFSSQTRRQLEIGLEIAQLAKEEIESGEDPKVALKGLVNQCLRRDEGWKEYYHTKMEDVRFETADPKLLDIYEEEAKAEKYYQAGKVDQARESLQRLLDDNIVGENDRGWYLQIMARMQYRSSPIDADELQKGAFRANRYLLKPRHGVDYRAVKAVPERRIEKIREWIATHADYEELRLHVTELIESLRFGVNSESFEQALNNAGVALGFDVQRPEKEWKEGPDNLWAIEQKLYILFEVKSEVLKTRKWIYKSESEQINNSVAWFRKHYPGDQAKNVLVIPPEKLNKDAAFDEAVVLLREKGLKRFGERVKGFFDEFASVDLSDMSNQGIATRLSTHKLRAKDFDHSLFDSAVWPAH